MRLYLKLIVIGIALLAVVIGLHFNFGSFVSDLYLQTQRKGAAIPADPTSPKGQYSKKTGGPCSGATSDDYDYDKDPPETAIGANGERHNVGSYDAKPNRKDDVDYTDTDVLNKPASTTYSDWALDPKTNSDIRSGSSLSDTQFKSSKGLDDRDLPSGRVTKEPYDYRYDTSLRSSRNFRNSGDHDEFDTEKIHEYAKKNRPSVDELIRAPPRTYSEIPTFKGKGSSEDDYLDNRLSRDYKTRERRFELPYQKTYNRAETSGYNIGTTCNNKSFGELQEDECCEGFSTFK